MKGFSLVEMMVTLTIFVILAVAAVSFYDTSNSVEDSLTEQVQQLIKVSRVESLRSRQTVVICSSASQENPVCSNNWDNPFIVAFTSNDGSNNFDSLTDTLIDIVSVPDSARYTFSWGAFPNVDYILLAGVGTGTNGTLVFCNNMTPYRKIVVSSRGHATVGQPQNGDVC